MASEGRFDLSDKREIPTGTINTIVAMYQLALSKALGTGSAALTQLILRDATEIADEMLKNLGIELGDIGNLEKDIPKIFKLMGISSKVEVEVPKDATAVGSTYVIKVYDSIFKPVALLLQKRGIKFTLSPESFIAAYVIRKALRKRDIKANVRIQVEPMKSPKEPLVIKIIIR